MSRDEQEHSGWDAHTEAILAFSCTDSVKAVIFCSDVAVIKRAERGPSRRRHAKLLQRLRELIRNGESDAVRLAIDHATWPGPKTIWWTSSIPELTEVIEHHDQIIRQRKIAAGVSVAESLEDSTIVFFHVWWDR